MCFKHELLCEHSSLICWRNRLDEVGSEELLAQTIEPSETLKAVKGLVADARYFSGNPYNCDTLPEHFKKVHRALPG